MKAKPGVRRLGIALVAARGPTNTCRHWKIYAQVFAGHEPATLLIGRPYLKACDASFALIALLGLRDTIPDGAFVQRAEKLDVLGVRPGERHAGTRGMAVEQVVFGDVVRIPHLLWNHAALAGLPCDGLQQLQCTFPPTGGEFVVRAFTSEQRPASADTTLVEGPPVSFFAITVIGRAMLRGAGLRLNTQRGIQQLHRVDDAGIVRRAQPHPH